MKHPLIATLTLFALGCGSSTVEVPAAEGTEDSWGDPSGLPPEVPPRPEDTGDTGGLDDTAGVDTADSADGDGSSSDDGGGADDGDSTIEPYAPCEQDSECGPGLVCFDLLGVSVCTALGCADDASLCGPAATCLVSAAVAEDGVCVNTGSDQFCNRECNDALKCNIDPACTNAGCCVAVDRGGCPESCAELGTMECEISPQCDAECCVD